MMHCLIFEAVLLFVVSHLLYIVCLLDVYVATVEGPPGADDDNDSVTDNFGGEHELFGTLRSHCLMFDKDKTKMSIY